MVFLMESTTKELKGHAHTTMLGKQEVAVIAPSWIGDSIEISTMVSIHAEQYIVDTPCPKPH
jgi:hypothetical protein